MKSIETSDLGSSVLHKIQMLLTCLITHFPIRILKIKFQLPNLTSNFETYKNVGKIFFIYRIYIQIGMKKIEGHV